MKGASIGLKHSLVLVRHSVGKSDSSRQTLGAGSNQALSAITIAPTVQNRPRSTNSFSPLCSTTGLLAPSLQPSHRQAAFSSNTKLFTQPSDQWPDEAFGVDYELEEGEKSLLKREETRLITDDHELEAHFQRSIEQAQIQQESEVSKGYPKGLDKNVGPIEAAFRFLAFGVPSHSFEETIIPDNINDLVSVHSYHDDKSETAVAFARGRRSYMEDSHKTKSFHFNAAGEMIKVKLNAIMDGHDGNECSNYAARNLVPFLTEELSEFNRDKLTNLNITNALIATAVKLSQSFNSKSLPSEEFSLDAGTTLNFSLEIGDAVYFVNVGDSKAIFISDSGDVKQLTADQTFDTPGFGQKIQERGGFINTISGKRWLMGRLAIPRSLGDHWANGVVSARPFVSLFEKKALGPGIIVHGSDGMFEKASIQQLAKRIQNQLASGDTLEQAAVDAVQTGFLNDVKDNMSLTLRRI